MLIPLILIVALGIALYFVAKEAYPAHREIHMVINFLEEQYKPITILTDARIQRLENKLELTRITAAEVNAHTEARRAELEKSKKENQ